MFDQFKEVISKTVNMLVITETKLDDTFPLGQFYVEGFIDLTGTVMEEV